MIKFINSLLPSDIMEAFGWMILHSLWQAAVISVVLGLLMIITRKFSARSRYFIAIAAMLFVPATAIYTFIRHYTPARPAAVEASAVKAPAAKTGDAVTAVNMPAKENRVSTVSQPAVQKGLKDRMKSYRKYFYQHIPLIVTLWMLGMLVFALKFLGGLAYTQRLKHYRVQPVTGEWQQVFNRLAKMLNLNKAVRILQSTLVKVPMVVGYFKPVVLIPVSAFTGLSPGQLETVILHELAHIVRKDYLMNILQSVVEIVFFYHPAVWWMSKIVRAEREHCCDDIAIEKSGDSVNFAKALANIQEQVLVSENLAMAIGNSSNHLIRRIKRLLNQPNMKSNFTEGFTASCIIFAGILIMMLNTGSAKLSVGENMQTKTEQFINDAYSSVDDTVKTTEPKKPAKAGNAEDQLFELEQERKAAAGDKRLAEEEKLRKEAGKAEKETREKEIEARKAREKAEMMQREAEKAKMEAERAREEEKRAAMEAERAREEVKRATMEAERTRAEAERAAREAERAGAEVENTAGPDDLLEEEILEGVEAGLENMDIDRVVDEAVSGAEAGINGMDLNRIVREALEGLRTGVEEVNADAIADEILRGIESAVYGIDFNVIAGEILSGVQMALEQIDVNRIVQYHMDDRTVQENFRGDPEQLNIIESGVGEWNQWRDRNPKVIPDLRGAFLSEANLNSADFHDALLDNINLKEAVLDWANLEGASLKCAILKEATFNGAHMMRADFSNADMKEVTLSGQLLRNTVFNGTNLKEADLSSADLRDSDLSAANLGEANLIKADLRGASLRGADLSNARLDGAKMQGAVINSHTLLPPGFKPDEAGMVIGD
jgi:beta-lactamase regulating signal transducer with metallopeptidase domain